uniref:Uncharacterized protein n=1 Tax=Ackermannviridae sp. TaxID=2831612 RepID=A0A8S5VKI7_9CAUD|nr:MAG TPA: hypothetical protein [Ackermannviridae sp.]
MKHGDKFLIADFLHGRSPLYYVAAVYENNYTLLIVVIQVVNCTKTFCNVLQSGFWDVSGDRVLAAVEGE